MKRFFAVFLLASFTFVWADIPLIYIHKVKLVMKDGSQISGYVLWPEEFNEVGPFESRKFLKHWVEHPNNSYAFRLFKAVYPIQERKYLKGLAHVKEDAIRVDAKLVKSIASVADPYEGREVTCGMPELTREEISDMQNPVVSIESMPFGEADVVAFNYDPKMKKKQLRRILSSYINMPSSGNYQEDIKKWKREVRPPKVVVLVVGCD